MNKENNLINGKEIFNPENIILNLIGLALITVALKGFMIPNKFLDGAFIVISILLKVLYLAYFFLRKRVFGKIFAIQSLMRFL